MHFCTCAALWGGQEYELLEMEALTALDSSEEIVAATRAHWPLVAQVELEFGNASLRAVLEFPIKQMNTLEATTWQVDTGPIVFHDLARRSPDSSLAEGLHLAFIAFNQLDSVDLILEAPTDIGHGMLVMEYSKRRRFGGKVWLFASARGQDRTLKTARAMFDALM